MQEIRKENEVLRRIAQASNAIRRKHKILKTGKESLQETIEEVFKPVVTPLQALVNVSRDAKPVKQDVKEKIKTETMNKPKNEMESEAEDSFATAEEEDQTITEQNELDTLYGVRNLSTAGLMIGNSPISFERNFIRIGSTVYPKTQGLLELLFKKMPNSVHVAPNDKKNYKNILLATNAHRKYYSATEPIRNTPCAKFKHLIAELLDINTSSPSSSKRTGEGVLLPQAWVTRQGVRTDYIFWDDANELVERLRLLTASQAAGNTSHNNEIMSILQELREAGIIY
ncbi:uncharacterized protein LOC124406252 [Diprion similis]|uniref:uncharacterized protein LOC124406252 n=1 Tax=Diprion similis TaxID=362088 RepID=UPI001EF85714|nr:uncharacterized protein LOC124406252 [Diprion similis]